MGRLSPGDSLEPQESSIKSILYQRTETQTQLRSSPGFLGRIQSFIYSFASFDKVYEGGYCVHSTLLGSGDTAMDETDKNL